MCLNMTGNQVLKLPRPLIYKTNHLQQNKKNKKEKKKNLHIPQHTTFPLYANNFFICYFKFI